MKYIQVFDDKRQDILNFKIGSNNRISRRYLSTMFPGISGLYYKNANGGLYVVELDENDNFVDEWNAEIIYKASFSDSRRSSPSSISWSKKVLYGLLAVGMIITIWVGSAISSLWANIYEDILKKLSIYIPWIASKSSSSSEPTISLTSKIVILIIFSIMYLLFALMITPTAIKSWWGTFKNWLLSIDFERLTYNPLFQPRGSDQS